MSNWNLAYAKPDVVSAKLSSEVALGRIAGPFCSLPVEDLRVSPLGLVLKKKPGKFHLILHLSSAEGLSVNDGIDQDVLVYFV